MKTTNDITEQFPKTNGMTVPEGYFDDFKNRMMAELPEVKAVAEPVQRSRWQVLRPYVYMAAMFAGVYLMMNLFSLTDGFKKAQGPQFSEVVNEQTIAYVDDYVTYSDIDLYDDLYEAGITLPESL